MLFLLISFIFFALTFRLFYIQIINGETLQNKAEDQWTRSLPITAQRGNIKDTNGVSLAESVTCYNLFTRAREIKNPTETATFLANFLNKPFSVIYDKLTFRGVSEVILSNNVSSENALKIYKKQLSGVYLTENSSRFYPYGDLLTQVLGFTTTDNTGQAGVELYYNDLLKGQNGYVMIQSELTGKTLENAIDVYVPATQGNNINLTIDVNMQKSVESVLMQIMLEQKAKSATGILMKAKTGEILALSTKPSFDLNNVPRDNVQTLMQTVKNQAVVDVYEPGSTFKIITMAIALETGTAKLTDRFFCNGAAVVDGEKIKCWKSIGHGSQSLAEGLANSCNCVFTALAQRIGLEKFYEYLHLFGYGKPTGITISGESGGILMNKNVVKVVDLARMGFGQAVAVTPLQQIVGVACAVNGGKLLMPYLIKNISDSQGELIKENTKQIKRTVISEETSKIINDMLELTVSMQTGKFTFVPGYAVGGKTGTTQKYENGAIASGKYISSFVGTYPVNNPEYILLISVDEPGAGAYYGSIVASPYAKIVFKDLFEYYNIPPDDPEIKTENIESLEMPSLVNLPLAKAVSLLNELGLSFEIDGSGSEITGQLPAAKQKVYKTDIVLIKT